MGDHARGDCKKVFCSSEEEELQQEAYHNSPYFPPITAVMMSQLNLLDKIPLPGTSGEAPAVPAPPTADDTDRQFWAEDEMSSSESRLRLICKQRRRHSLAYRNRVAIRKRSRSLLCQSSSSNSDPAAHLKILPPIRYNGKHERIISNSSLHRVRRRRRCNHRPGPSVTKKSKAGSNVSTFRTPTPRPPLDSKIPTPPTVAIQFGIQHPNLRRRVQASYTSPVRRRSGGRRSQIPNFPCSSNIVLPMNNESLHNDKYRNENPRPPSTSKRK